MDEMFQQDGVFIVYGYPKLPLDNDIRGGLPDTNASSVADRKDGRTGYSLLPSAAKVKMITRKR
jgi:hypothetical protein